MRRDDSLKVLVTYFYPWQVLQAFCALLHADGLAGVFSQPPIQSVRGMLSSGLQVSQRQVVWMTRSEKLRVLIPLSVVWELHNLESCSAP